MADAYTLPGLNFLPRGGGSDPASLMRMFETAFSGGTPVPSRFGIGYDPIPSFQFIGIRFRTSRRFNRAIRYLEDQFPKRMERITSEIHENIALSVIEDARLHYRDGQRANRRPGATGRLMRFLTNPAEYEKITSWTPRRVSVNFNSMDLFLNTDKGFPYWRSANYGYGPFQVEESALFITSAGRFAFPFAGSAKRDPKVVQRLARGATFSIQFEGYGFVEHAIEKARSGGKREYTSRLKEELREITEVDAIRFTRFFIGGGRVDSGGRLRDAASGRFVRGTLRDF